MEWKIGNYERVAGKWIRNGVTVVTGSAVSQLLRQDGFLSLEYLQNDQLTWSTSPQNHNLTLDGDGFWAKVFRIPTSAANYTVIERVQHSDTSLPVLSTTHFVSDSAENQIQLVIGGGIQAEIGPNITIESIITTNQPIEAEIEDE